MSALRRIRENVGLVITVIAISLFAFVFVDLFKNIGNGPDNQVATVNGKSVSIQDLEAKLQVVERNAGEMDTQEKRDQARQQAWESLVREIAYGAEWSKAGIMVTDEEVAEMFRGRLLHPYAYNSGYFRNPRTGQVYDPIMVDSVFGMADQINLDDPNIDENYKRWKIGLMDLREAMIADRKGTKWQQMIAKAMLVSDNELTRNYNESQRSANISYVQVPYASIEDAKVSVSESDFSEYYSKHKARFKRETEAKIKYTFFQVIPSAMDSSDTRDNLTKIKSEFLSAPKPFDFALTSGDAKSIDTSSKPVHELPAAVLSILGRTDTVLGPVATEGGFSLYRIVKVEEDSASVLNKVRHVLLQMGPTTPDSASVQAKAKELVAKLQSDSTAWFTTAFAESKDEQTKAQGGSLGWISTSPFGPDFDKAVNGAAIGSVITVKTPLGTHIVQVTDRTRKKYAVASLFRALTPSQATSEAVYKRATGYLGEVLGGGDMDKTLATYPEGQTRVSPLLTQGTYSLLGVQGARPVINWAFKHKAGDITEELLEVEDAMVVARVEYIGEKGYKALEDVKEEIRPEVIRWVKARDIKKKLAAATGSDLNAIAAAYGPGATVGTAADVRFSSSMVNGLGDEPKVVGRAFGLKANEVSKPIAGVQGVYIVRLDALNEGAPAAPEILAMQRMGAKENKSRSGVNASFQGMIDAADIHDYRSKFDF
jgi:peptidyl-prolyl cis-trans isomerase D